MSNFTFLTGASHPEELVQRAAELGLSAIAITDRNSLAGVVRAHVALREIRREAAARPPKKGVTGEDVRKRARIRSQTRLDPSSRQSFEDRVTEPAQEPPAPRFLSTPKLIVGTRLTIQDAVCEWTALPTDRAAYGRLCRLLTIGKRRAEKGGCTLFLSDLAEWGADVILLAHPPEAAEFGRRRAMRAQPVIAEIAAQAARFPGAVFTAAAPRYDGRDDGAVCGDRCDRAGGRRADGGCGGPAHALRGSAAPCGCADMFAQRRDH